MVYMFWKELIDKIGYRKFAQVLTMSDMYIKSNRVLKNIKTKPGDYIFICMRCTERILNKELKWRIKDDC